MTDFGHPRYALSFTSGGLLVRECVLCASVYLECREWKATRARIQSENLLQARTVTSNQRVTREVVRRVSVLSDDEIGLLVASSPTEQVHMVWAAVCRQYEIIGEFAEEVLRERFLLMTPTLSFEHFDRFLTGKTLWHSELDELKPSTSQKLRRVLFQMLREAGFLTDTGDIVPTVFTTRILETLQRRVPSDVRFFPTTTSPEVHR